MTFGDVRCFLSLREEERLARCLRAKEMDNGAALDAFMRRMVAKYRRDACDAANWVDQYEREEAR